MHHNIDAIQCGMFANHKVQITCECDIEQYFALRKQISPFKEKFLIILTLKPSFEDVLATFVALKFTQTSWTNTVTTNTHRNNDHDTMFRPWFRHCRPIPNLTSWNNKNMLGCRYFMNTIQRVTLLVPANQWKRRLTCTETSDFCRPALRETMSKSFETPRYPSAEQQVVDALLWSFFGPAFLKQFLSLEHSTGEHGEHGSKFQRFNLLGDIASHISTWLTEDISSCIKHHFTYKVCIQLSAFFIFYHHHLSHKVAIIPLDWICENSSISKTLAYL